MEWKMEWKTVKRVYWSELNKDLSKYLIDFNQQNKWADKKKDNLRLQIIDFCAQGTGYQRELYHYIRLQVKNNPTDDKSTYDIFVRELSTLCAYLDKHYLSKHPKKKKTIKSIKDMSEWYWVESD